jgi:hypothetical protein
MTSRVIPLQDLAQRINQHQAELDTLRKEYEARQADLRRFTRRKEELQAELVRVESEIQALGQGAPPTAASAPTPPKNGQASAKRPVAKASSNKSGSAPTQPLSLPKLLQIVGEATVPMTVKMLTEEAVRRNYATTSNNLAALVDTRISELIKKGLVRRAKNQPGVVAVTTSAKGQAQAVRSQPPGGPEDLPESYATSGREVASRSKASQEYCEARVRKNGSSGSRKECSTVDGRDYEDPQRERGADFWARVRGARVGNGLSDQKQGFHERDLGCRLETGQRRKHRRSRLPAEKPKEIVALGIKTEESTKHGEQKSRWCFQPRFSTIVIPALTYEMP